jgi:hypothetical protein
MDTVAVPQLTVQPELLFHDIVGALGWRRRLSNSTQR